MAYTTIDDPTAYFKIQLYTGTGSSNAQTFADTDTDMQPNMVWIKSRSDAFNHMLYDSVRGVHIHLKPDGTNAEATDSNALTAFGPDVYVIVLCVPVSSVYVNGFGNSTSSTDTG